MKITKFKLKQIIKEELEKITEVHGLGGEDPPTSGDIKFSGQYEQAFDDDTTSKIHSNPKLAGHPESWLRMADRLKQMSRVWVDPEDGKMLELAGAILRSAFEQSSAELESSMQGVDALELPGAPSTKSLDHQRRRTFRNP